MEEREREWGARSPGAGSPARPPSPRLDVNSDSFDPLLALYAPRLPPIPYPNAPCFNNVAAYETFLRTGGRGGGRGRARGADPGSGAPAAAAGPSGRTRRRPDAPAPDPERIERLRRLMVRKEGDEAAGGSRRAPARSRRAPRNVLTRMPRECRGRAGGDAGVAGASAEGRGAACEGRVAAQVRGEGALGERGTCGGRVQSGGVGLSRGERRKL